MWDAAGVKPMPFYSRAEFLVKSFFFFNILINFNWIITYSFVMVFAIHRPESATGIIF